jgi:hypothetical protein
MTSAASYFVTAPPTISRNVERPAACIVHVLEIFANDEIARFQEE